MSSTINDSTFRVYEEYALSDRNIDKALNKLVEGSEYYNYLKCIDILTKRKDNLTKEDISILKAYAKSSETNESKEISLKLDLLQYDKATTPEEKKEILEKIAKKHLKLKFDHPRPIGVSIKTEPNAIANVKEETKALLDAVDTAAEIDKLYKEEKQPYDFSHEILAKVDFQKLKKETFITLIEVMREDLVMIDSPTFYKTFIDVFFNDEAYYSRMESMITNMTLQQLDKLKTYKKQISEDVNFASQYTSKLFCKELDPEINQNISYKEKQENLVKMYEYAKKLPFKLAGLKSHLLLQLLENGKKLDYFNKDYFLEYLKMPVRDFLVLKKIVPEAHHWETCTSGIQVNRSGRDYNSMDKELLTCYLTKLFKAGEKVSKFEEFLDKKFLVEVWEDAMLTSGTKVELDSHNTTRLEKLAAEVRINICEHNKDAFDIGDDVSLWVELKNVSSLFVNVFEVNIENYYRKYMSPFKTDINLDGLIAAIEKSYEYKYPPQVCFKEEFKLPELKGKSGLFVVEFIGNGKSSRAVLKIGSLTFISKPTIAGQVCYILDGERNVCMHNSTGIWMDNQLFSANLDKKGRIIVPYLPSGGKTSKAILLHQGLAQLVDFPRLEERYSLTCGFFLLPESFIEMKKASILIRPQLFVNNRPADINLLKNIQCVLSTSNYVDKIPSSKSFDNLELDSKKELVISFQVASQLLGMEIQFSADVENITKGNCEKLSNSHKFNLVTHVSDYSLAEMYLSLTNNVGYEVFVLGKNGEPISNSLIEFNFLAKDFNYPIILQANTNSKGAVLLGKLGGVKGFTANCFQSGGKQNITKAWNLPDLQIVKYPTQIDVIEKEDIEIPFAGTNITTEIYMNSLINSVVISDVSHLIKVEKQADSLYSTLKVKGLSEGVYKISGLGDKKVIVNVHKGKYWGLIEDYILKKNSLLENSQKSKCIKIKGVSFSEEKDKKVKMTVKVEGITKSDWRIHVMMFRYLPENVNEIAERFITSDYSVRNEYFFQKWTNFYLSNRELSSEFRYCFERRKMERFTGNTLEKPRLLLKRNFIQGTESSREAVQEGTKYALEQENESRFLAKHMVGRDEYRMSTRMQDLARLTTNDRLPLYQNFLLNEPLALYNLPGDESGAIAIELENDFAEKHGFLLILAVDKGSVAQYLCPLKGNARETRDLSLAKPLDETKFYGETRTTKCVYQYETHTIDDYSSTVVQYVDSLEKVLTIIKELMRNCGSHIADLDKFERLINWNKLGTEEKTKMMSFLTSHEFHLYIYKKDKDFFKSVIRPYLINKMEKTFIDYYLLQDNEKLLNFAESPISYPRLNTLEKTLLIESLLLQGKKELAARLAKGLRDDLSGQKKSVSDINRVFDTVLSLNMLKTRTSSKFIFFNLNRRHGTTSGVK